MGRTRNQSGGFGLAVASIIGLLVGFIPITPTGHEAYAAVTTGDNFNNNEKDPDKWGSDEVDGKGVLSEVNQRLEYTTTAVGTASHDSVDREWILTRFPYRSDWAIQMDVTNTTSPGSGFNGFGIDIRSLRLPADEIEIELANGYFWAEFYGGKEISGDGYVSTGGPANAAIRIEFNSTTKVFTVYYDTDPSDGYQWTEFGSFGVAGTGGANGTRDWGLKETDQFAVYVFGYSEQISVASGELYGDNFLAGGGETTSLTVVKPEANTGTGTVTSSPKGIDCGAVCTALFKNKTKVSLTPFPDSGSVFTGWTDGCTGTGVCSVTITGDITVGASFETGYCSYSLSSAEKKATYKKSTITLKVTAADHNYCPPPDIINNTDFVTYTAAAFTKNKGSITFYIPENDSSEGRSGTFTIGENTFTITQGGKPCVLSLSSPNSPFFDKTGGDGSFTVSVTPADCQWTAAPDSKSTWVHVTGTVGGEVRYTVDENTGKSSRSGKIPVTLVLSKKVKPYTVRQANK